MANHEPTFRNTPFDILKPQQPDAERHLPPKKDSETTKPKPPGRKPSGEKDNPEPETAETPSPVEPAPRPSSMGAARPSETGAAPEQLPVVETPKETEAVEKKDTLDVEKLKRYLLDDYLRKGEEEEKADVDLRCQQLLSAINLRSKDTRPKKVVSEVVSRVRNKTTQEVLAEFGGLRRYLEQADILAPVEAAPATEEILSESPDQQTDSVEIRSKLRAELIARGVDPNKLRGKNLEKLRQIQASLISPADALVEEMRKDRDSLPDIRPETIAQEAEQASIDYRLPGPEKRKAVTNKSTKLRNELDHQVELGLSDLEWFQKLQELRARYNPNELKGRQRLAEIDLKYGKKEQEYLAQSKVPEFPHERDVKGLREVWKSKNASSTEKQKAVELLAKQFDYFAAHPRLDATEEDTKKAKDMAEMYRREAQKFADQRFRRAEMRFDRKPQTEAELKADYSRAEAQRKILSRNQHLAEIKTEEQRKINRIKNETLGQAQAGYMKRADWWARDIDRMYAVYDQLAQQKMREAGWNEEKINAAMQDPKYKAARIAEYKKRFNVKE